VAPVAAGGANAARGPPADPQPGVEEVEAALVDPEGDAGHAELPAAHLDHAFTGGAPAGPTPDQAAADLVEGSPKDEELVQIVLDVLEIGKC
jgi:hypothetical protein